MPEWLKKLLLANGSAGFADSLSTLVGRAPTYERLPDSRRYSSDQTVALGGRFYADRMGNPVIGLSPHTVFAYGRRGAPGRPGYRAADNQQRLGDFVLGHEFGHMAGSGVGNVELARQLAEVDPAADTSEEFADDFQNAVQFLRHGTTDTLRLNPRSRHVVRVLLKHDPYKGHALNRPQPDTLESRLRERAASKDSTRVAPKTLEQLLQSHPQPRSK